MGFQDALFLSVRSSFPACSDSCRRERRDSEGCLRSMPIVTTGSIPWCKKVPPRGMHMSSAKCSSSIRVIEFPSFSLASRLPFQGLYQQYSGVEWEQKPGAPPVLHLFDSEGDKFSTVTIEKEWSADDLHELLQKHGFVRYAVFNSSCEVWKQTWKQTSECCRSVAQDTDEGEREDL